MDMTTAAVDEGADLWPQVAGRATGLLSGHFTTYCIFDVVPAYQELKAQKLTPAALIGALRTAEVRRAILEWQPDEESAIRIAAACDRTYVLGDPPQYEPGPERSLSALAAAAGRSAPRGRVRRAFGRRWNRVVVPADPQLCRREPRTGA